MHFTVRNVTKEDRTHVNEKHRPGRKYLTDTVPAQKIQSLGNLHIVSPGRGSNVSEPQSGGFGQGE